MGNIGPGESHFAIIPDDDNDLAHTVRAVFVGTGGTLVVRDRQGVDVTYTLPDNFVFPFRAVRILEASTATDLVGWF